jgi:hypothetical protein
MRLASGTMVKERVSRVMPGSRARPKADPRTGSRPASTPSRVARKQGVGAGAKPRHDGEGWGGWL